LKPPTTVFGEKLDAKNLSAADFFSGFGGGKKALPEPEAQGFSNIEIPDFLKK